MKTATISFAAFVLGVLLTAWAYHDSYHIYHKGLFGVQTNLPYGNVNVYPTTEGKRFTILSP